MQYGILWQSQERAVSRRRRKPVTAISGLSDDQFNLCPLALYVERPQASQEPDDSLLRRDAPKTAIWVKPAKGENFWPIIALYVHKLNSGAESHVTRSDLGGAIQ